ncbi:MAG: 23S rRNA (adenine(2503)-C(2))-methyltransferase RlmN [Chlamydiales bacterium]|nr:23S rRNA (adenine(2503)-C(2))-methyltransferase RlmN [Chlamydiales bacterium]
MSNILGFQKLELEQKMLEIGEKKFRAKQLLEWVYQKGTLDFSQMTNLSVSLQEKLSQEFPEAPLKLVKNQLSTDKQTTKLLWRLSDNLLVESVIIEAPGRVTLCVSSQVGCPARCAFCASGKNGLMRNLEASEIVGQVYYTQKLLQEEGKTLSNIVFMGMGEPLINYDNVKQTLKILTSPEMMGFSQRRITVSTVGIPDKIRDFSKEGLKVSLVLSLHAPNQKVRKKIIPYARLYELEDLLDAMQEFSKMSKRDVTYEYILIKGINDQKEHALELAELLKGQQCTVNLIPYNPVEGLNLERPDSKQVLLFRDTLQKKKILNTCRFTKGVDIAAACGQLALQNA